MKRRILTVPHEVLRRVSMPAKLTKDVLGFTHDLEETLMKKSRPRGVGLSAPQIGKNLRIFCTYLPREEELDDPDAHAELITFINPQILETSGEMTFGPDKEHPYLEGCLSIPSLYGPVPRHTWVRVGYFTPSGEQRERVFENFLGRVVQHEYDHLEGILFTDYAFKHDLPIYEFKKGKMHEIDRSVAKAF